MPRKALIPVCALCLVLGCATAPGGVDDGGPDAWEQEIVAELNRLRSDPAGYAERYVAALLSRYRGRLLFYPGEPVTLTDEGKAAALDCLEALRAASPAPPLLLEPSLTRAARDHVADTGPLGLLGHFGSDGGDPRDRVARVDPSLGGVSEAIHYGRGDARRIVLSLLLDDAVPSRSHRLGLLNPQAGLVGAARGAHRGYGTMTVIDLARPRPLTGRVSDGYVPGAVGSP